MCVMTMTIKTKAYVVLSPPPVAAALPQLKLTCSHFKLTIQARKVLHLLPFTLDSQKSEIIEIIQIPVHILLTLVRFYQNIV